MSSPSRRVLFLVGLVLSLGACRSKLTGNEGNLDFEYVADDDVRNFNKPIAVGAKLEVIVTETGTGRTVDLVSATTDEPTVLKVDGLSGNRFVLSGVGAGESLVSVKAEMPSGAVKPDSINMLARVPEVLKLKHTCTSDSEGLFFVNQDVVVAFEMEMKNGQPVIGYGYHPIEILPAAGVAVDKTTKDQQFLHLMTGATRQTVTLRSTLGDGASAGLKLVEQGEVDGASLHSSSPLSTQVGKSLDYHVLPTVAGRAVCQPLIAMTAASTTPEICEVAAAGTPANPTDETENEYGFVRVTGKKVGRCAFAVTYPAGRAGSGATASLTVDIVEIVRP